MIIVGFLAFWMGAIGMYVGVWLLPLYAPTRRKALVYWLSQFFSGAALMGYVAKSLGYEKPWQSATPEALLSWAIVAVGLVIALRKPPASAIRSA